MSQELALKFSTADPEQLLGILPTEEVLEIIKFRMREEVQAEVRGEFNDRIDDLENEVEELGGWEDTADRWERDAIGLYRAIEHALTVPWNRAIPLLQKAIEEHGGDIEPIP
ncbi:hypothetical protein ACVT81_000548 [Yersinia enterocolitica]|uniref:Uncharacterized protein n=1 Tax=Yersinia aldovae TaxID=29483 RepID=A0ABM9SUH6_YERAL|nr:MULTISPECIES: hypothetical protein [Yersinia]EKN3570335.1 hypothetical protein [Yersinia enterocolitica]EKN4744693.1 hypothetical protein [Yersinia enterocolitica]EKN4839813.1 hypothetical protein [Yersinia enterocolitica]EKN6271626.1 hypothetical protein [Yersinia enterocolitica]CND61803.1 Uncharacterised protein [Yersinia intermedia]